MTNWRLLTAESTMDCADEDAFAQHADATARILRELEAAAEELDGMWDVHSHYLDRVSAERYNLRLGGMFKFPGELNELIDMADIKNGIDVALDDKGRVVIIAYGQGYTDIRDNTYGTVTQVFTCGLVLGERADDIREALMEL